jgi:hypothetical protein
MGHEAAVAPEPGEGALDNPAPAADQLEPALFVRSLHDFQRNTLRGQIGCEPVAAVAAVRKNVLDEREQAAGLFDEVHGSVPVLSACRDNLNTKQQSYRIGKSVALDTFDLFACIETNKIPALPPFSVALAA